MRKSEQLTTGNVWVGLYLRSGNENLPVGIGLSPGWELKRLRLETTEDCVLSPRTTTKDRQAK